MGPSLLIDTDVFIDYLRDHPPAKGLFSGTVPEHIAFSAITETELLSGRINDDPAARGALLRFLGHLQKVAVDNPIAKRAGDIRRETGIGSPDAIIAATAIELKAELVTRNVKHFQGIRGLKARKPY